ncbi:16S rRNA (cytosine(1402)-N(4))-methyltransferase RsmH [Planctomycetota bacterium]|nr:16S rRNA (cytosine(1402)-N(4))-methyltransferase RsmH [Planctomycetota bacterium]
MSEHEGVSTPEGESVYAWGDIAGEIGHIPVLWREVLDLLAIGEGKTVLDCTVGRGGHGLLMMPNIKGGRYIGLDTDASNAAYARERLSEAGEKHSVKVNIIHSNFVNARHALDGIGVDKVDVLLADLGFASNQMDDPERGLSFKGGGKLDMRLDMSQGVTAGELVNELPEKELADLIYGYGEERLSRRIAKKIVEIRHERPIETTEELADLVRGCYPGGSAWIGGKRPAPWKNKGKGGKGRRGGKGGGQRGGQIDPATRTFMALRIAVNGELDALDHLLNELPVLLDVNGRAGIISFHSLEDRRVKNKFRDMAQGKEFYKRITRKVVIAAEDECEQNPRSRSAKMRVIERIK